MPNWCHNRLTVTGEPAELDRFIRRAAGVGEDGQPVALTFAGHAPAPDNPEQNLPEDDWRVQLLRRLGLEPDLLTWREVHWGTKWDPVATTEIGKVLGTDDSEPPVPETPTWLRTDDSATLAFLSAWTPPVEWLAAASAAHPALTFVLRYAEVGNDFGGQAIARAGQVEVEDLPVGDVLPPEEHWF